MQRENAKESNLELILHLLSVAKICMASKGEVILIYCFLWNGLGENGRITLLVTLTYFSTL